MNYIYVGNIGNRANGHWHITKPMILEYAEKVNAEVIILKESSFKSAFYVLFDAFKDSVEKGEEHKYMWMDNDILISPNALNVFDLPDKFLFTPFQDRKPKHWRKLWQRQGVIDPHTSYYCTGMVKWSARHVKDVYDWVKNRSFPYKWADQEAMAEAIYHLELPAFHMPENVHKVTHYKNKLDEHHSFYHFGGKNKPHKMYICLANGGFDEKYYKQVPTEYRLLSRDEAIRQGAVYDLPTVDSNLA